MSIWETIEVLLMWYVRRAVVGKWGFWDITTHFGPLL